MTETMKRVIEEQCSFITSEDRIELEKENPFMEVLIRTGANRYTCAIRDIDFVFDIVKIKKDYVRDVSLSLRNTEQILSGKSSYSVFKTIQHHKD